MRKKGITVGMALISAALLTACGSAGAGTPAATEVETTAAVETAEASVVYFTSDITPEGMMKVYEQLNWTPEGKVAVKLSTGEPPASNYLKPELIKNLVQSVNGTIVECNTAYGGSRMETAMHRQVAEDHGFTAIAEVDIMDADGSMSIPVEGGVRLTENLVGSHFADYDSYLVLSHFKGHAMAGFGGAIKNISIDCDCDGNPAEPDIHDIGIVASTDPVAIDQACIDLAFAAEGSESLQNRVNEREGPHTLEHAEAIGLGTRSYELVSVDD